MPNLCQCCYCTRHSDQARDVHGRPSRHRTPSPTPGTLSPPSTPSTTRNAPPVATLLASPRCKNHKCENYGEEIPTEPTMSKKNFNEGRPRWYCKGCQTFYGFADDRGICASRKCDCGQPTRVMAVGKDKPNPFSLFFKCRTGQCNFRENSVDPANPDQIIVFDEETIRKLSVLGMI